MCLQRYMVKRGGQKHVTSLTSKGVRCSCMPWNVKNRWPLPEARKRQGRMLPSPRGPADTLVLDFSLQNCERINCYCSTVFGTLLEQF